MHYRRLGKSGLKVSEISLGSWVTFGNQVDQKLRHRSDPCCLRAGDQFFDNADVYAEGKAEILMGKRHQGPAARSAGDLQ